MEIGQNKSRDEGTASALIFIGMESKSHCPSGVKIETERRRRRKRNAAAIFFLFLFLLLLLKGPVLSSKIWLAQQLVHDGYSCRNNIHPIPSEPHFWNVNEQRWKTLRQQQQQQQPASIKWKSDNSFDDETKLHSHCRGHTHTRNNSFNKGEPTPSHIRRSI